MLFTNETKNLLIYFREMQLKMTLSSSCLQISDLCLIPDSRVQYNSTDNTYCIFFFSIPIYNFQNRIVQPLGNKAKLFQRKL